MFFSCSTSQPLNPSPFIKPLPSLCPDMRQCWLVDRPHCEFSVPSQKPMLPPITVQPSPGTTLPPSRRLRVELAASLVTLSSSSLSRSSDRRSSKVLRDGLPPCSALGSDLATATT